MGYFSVSGKNAAGRGGREMWVSVELTAGVRLVMELYGSGSVSPVPCRSFSPPLLYFDRRKKYVFSISPQKSKRSNSVTIILSINSSIQVCVDLNIYSESNKKIDRLINEETIPAVLLQVVDLLNHQKEAVRKKAIMALHRFHRKSPSSVSHLISNFRKRLCDNDPGVMGATLCPLFDLISEDVTSYKDLVSSFVSILKQVTERRLPKSYDYHQMHAPFIQIKLLKIMALLGSGDKNVSEMMYMVLGDLFRKCDSSTNIGNAILYECIRCISSILPNPKLLEAAAEAISKFLKSDSHNLKYMGIDGLGRLIKISPDIAEQHQLAVIDCLEMIH